MTLLTSTVSDCGSDEELRIDAALVSRLRAARVPGRVRPGWCERWGVSAIAMWWSSFRFEGAGCKFA